MNNEGNILTSDKGIILILRKMDERRTLVMTDKGQPAEMDSEDIKKNWETLYESPNNDIIISLEKMSEYITN